jgi:hypothetical protein
MTISRHPFLFLVLAFFLLCCLGGQFGPIGAGALTLWPGDTDAAPLVLPAGKFILLFVLTWILGGLLFFFFPRRISTRETFFLILAVSLVARLLLLPHPVSDDIYRYLWEGRVYLSDHNPYLFPPDHPELAALAAGDPHHPLINHPAMAAIYPPAMLLLFAAVGQFCYHPLAVKLTVVCFDLGTLYLLLLLLTRRQLPLRYALLYALNPVILYGFAGQGHLDSLQGFFLLAAVVAHEDRRWGWMWLMAGAAVQVKYMAVVALPFLLTRENRRWAWTLAVALGLPFLPFLEAGPGLFATLIRFGRDFGVGGPLHSLLRPITGQIALASLICLLVAALSLSGVAIFFHRRRAGAGARSPDRGIYLAFGILLLCLPTVHFWYLSWILPFVVLYPSNAWLLLTLTSAAYFSAYGQRHLGGEWVLTWPYHLIQWLPFGLLLAPELMRGIRHLGLRRQHLAGDRPLATVTAIVPTRNEAAAIEACIHSLRRDPAVAEVLVVDGGSSDQTVMRAEGAGARVIRHLRAPARGGGRGGQIAVGVRAARGDLIAIVHADTRVAAGSLSRACRLLNRQSDLIGGALGARFESSALFYRLLTMANDIRAVILGISFGDQVQFFKRRAFLACSTYPDLPLMEDVELSLRLGRSGRQAFLFDASTVSVRRWRRAGPGHALKVMMLFTRYLWQRLWGPVDGVAFFHAYYGDSPSPPVPRQPRCDRPVFGPPDALDKKGGSVNNSLKKKRI